jgi:hypothetical protein
MLIDSVKVEGMDQQEVNVSSWATPLVELVLQKALLLLIAFSIQKPFMFINMVTIASKLVHSTNA